MAYHYEATLDFENSISEVDTLLELAYSDVLKALVIY